MNNYIRLLSKHKWGLSLIASLVILIGLILWNNQAEAQEDGTVVLSVKDQDSGISYAIGVDSQAKEVNAEIDFESTVVGIDRYRSFNNRVLDELLQEASAPAEIPVKITFNSPLEQADFVEFTEQYDVEVKNYLIYMLEPDGNIATIQGGPSETELVPSESFDVATSSITQEYAPGTEFLGWVEVNGVAQLTALPKIRNDQRVFLVDVMQVFLASKLTDEALTQAGIARNMQGDLINAGFTEIYQKPLAWDLYYLGLMEENPKLYN